MTAISPTGIRIPRRRPLSCGGTPAFGNLGEAVAARTVGRLDTRTTRGVTTTVALSVSLAVIPDDDSPIAVTVFVVVLESVVVQEYFHVSFRSSLSSPSISPEINSTREQRLSVTFTSFTAIVPGLVSV